MACLDPVQCSDWSEQMLFLTAAKNPTLTDHIVTSCSEKVVQAGIIETSLSDHQLIFCTRTI